MEPKTRIWIDAKHQVLGPKNFKEVKYCFKEELTQDFLQQVYSALGNVVAGIEVLPDHSINIRYNTQNVTPTFIDFALKKKGLQFTRKGG